VGAMGEDGSEFDKVNKYQKQINGYGDSSNSVKGCKSPVFTKCLNNILAPGSPRPREHKNIIGCQIFAGEIKKELQRQNLTAAKLWACFNRT
jgi:hypothetical protein